MTQHEAGNGWVYLACEQGRDEDKNVCFVCTGKDEAPAYLANVRDTVLKYYKEADMRCYCDGSVLLSESKSETNPGRLYFKCRMKEGKCDFFQWADLAPKGKVKRWLEYGEPPRPRREYTPYEERPSRECTRYEDIPRREYQSSTNYRPPSTDRKPHHDPRMVLHRDTGRGRYPGPGKTYIPREPPKRYEPYRRPEEYSRQGYPKKSFGRRPITDSC